VLFPAGYFDLQTGFREGLLHFQSNGIDLSAVLAAQCLQPIINRPERLRFKLLERQKLHFSHIFVHAHPLCQRCIDIHSLARDPLAFLWRFDEMQRSHIVKTVRKLDQQDPNILTHREQEFAQVFCCAFILWHCLNF